MIFGNSGFTDAPASGAIWHTARTTFERGAFLDGAGFGGSYLFMGFMVSKRDWGPKHSNAMLKPAPVERLGEQMPFSFSHPACGVQQSGAVHHIHRRNPAAGTNFQLI